MSVAPSVPAAKKGEPAAPGLMPTQQRDFEGYIWYCDNQLGQELVGELPRPGEKAVDIVSWAGEQRLFRDIRGEEDQWTLETAGFQLLRHKSAIKEWTQEQDVRKAYEDETKTAVQELTGAAKVLAYDYRLRHLQGPARAVHVDFNENALFWRLHKEVGDEAHDLIRKYRVQVITVWRPFHTVYKDPLGLVDGRSCSKDDFVEYNVRPAGGGLHEYATMSYLPLSRDTHRWYYVHEQKPDECWLIRNYDTEDNRGPKFVPHGSPIDKAYESYAKRESVEVRLFVFHEKV